MSLRGIVVLCAALMVDVACAKVQCQYNTECGQSARCVENRCVTDCFADRDCPSATPYCTANGECVAVDPGDAATADAPAVDASTDVPVEIDVVAAQDVVTPDVPVAADVVAPPDVPVAVDVVTLRDVPAVIDVVTPRDVPAVIDVVTPRDVPAVIDVVTPRDVPAVIDVVTPRDMPSGGVVTPGFYEYTAVRPDTLIYPAAAAWHPGGRYALILANTDAVYRYDVATGAITRVARTSTSLYWRHVSFTPDGSRAMLLGNIGSGSTRQGKIYDWNPSAETLTERTTNALTGGGYESIAWSPDRTRGVLLAARQPSGSANTAGWWLDASGNVGAYAFAYGLAAGSACEDVDFATDGFGDPALAVVCGVNTGMILSVTNLDSSPRVSVAQNPGSVGNVSRIATHPQGALSLAIGSSSNRLYRLHQGQWTVGFNTPTLAGAYDVAFNDVGSRALAYGGNGRVWEFRTDLFDRMEISDVSISGLNSPPYNQPSNAFLRAVAWRPGCDEGLAVGGSSSLSGSTAFVAYFRVTNGRACPN
ncbi:MAG: hypothetical protein R3A48_21885 [Polyangiales bacterium]